MTTLTDMESDFRTFVNTEGLKVSIKHKTLTFNAGSYDEGIWAESGTAVTGSVFLQPLSYRTGGDETRYLTDGALTLSDRKMFCPSGLDVQSGCDVVIAGGSYDAMAIKYIPNETQLVYQKVFLKTKKVD